VRLVEGYPTGQGDSVRSGKELGVANCYPAGQGSRVQLPGKIR
jgi:hypothetical protein